MAVRELTTVMSGELSQAVLYAIFCDPEVNKALALAGVMKDTARGAVPAGAFGGHRMARGCVLPLTALGSPVQPPPPPAYPP